MLQIPEREDIFLVALHEKTKQICNGILVTYLHFATVANCVVYYIDNIPSLFATVVGKNILTTEERFIASIKPHEKYDPTTSFADIAVVTVNNFSQK